MQAALPVRATESPAAAWRNWLYLISLAPATLTVFGNLAGGPWAATNFVVSLLGISVLELVLPRTRSNNYHESRVPDAILLLHVLAPLATFGTLFYGISSGSLQGWTLFWAAGSVGVHSGASSTVVAHELCHRKEAFWKWGSKWLFFTTGNPYFYVAHLRVHHRLVGTTEDTTTARFGEWSYAFIVRSAFGQLRDAFTYEAERLRKAGKAPYGPQNYAVGMLGAMVALNVVLGFTLGPWAVFAYLRQALLANVLLELTNYIEHYGLTRTKLERVGPAHAWDSDHVTRFFLVELTRHADHHMNGSLHYHTLKHQPQSPKLPTGYAGMVLLALVPPVYFALIHPRLRRYQQALAAA
ncbi:MAG: alkane 1-monooxygenase [Bacteroidia bacterium]|nr:alkane 1-monooxygenase [Bacteroidia bacterium]